MNHRRPHFGGGGDLLLRGHHVQWAPGSKAGPVPCRTGIGTGSVDNNTW